jgi:cobalt-zinc-cadmium efflux system protein
VTAVSQRHGHAKRHEERVGARIALSFFITSVFVVVEAAAGIWADSLALLSDAGHNLTDVIALGLTWYAARLSVRPPHAGKTFGYHRAGILVALANSTTLVIISVGIFYQALRRFQLTPEVKPGILIGVGTAAFLINLGTAWLVRRGSENDLNLRSAFVHLMGDVFSTIGAVVAGIVIFFTGWNWLDPLVSVFIGLLIVWNAAGILRETVHILLESTPRNVDMKKMLGDLLGVKGVRGVHDLHAWSLTESLRALSAHIVTDDISISQGGEIQHDINELVRHRYGIGHTTLQLECAECESCFLYCDMAKNHPRQRKEPS